MSGTDVQCQLANAVSQSVSHSNFVQSMAIIGTGFVMFCVFVLCTMGMFYYGYLYGRRTIQQKDCKNKMTMPPVTYTAVRKVQTPRFGYSSLIVGVW